MDPLSELGVWIGVFTDEGRLPIPVNVPPGVGDPPPSKLPVNAFIEALGMLAVPPMVAPLAAPAAVPPAMAIENAALAAKSIELAEIEVTSFMICSTSGII